MKDTAEYLYRLTMGGIMERNEVRAKLDLNPIAGLDEPLTPMNMTTDTQGAGEQTAKQGALNA
jgi:phage portal protein BeeE